MLKYVEIFSEMMYNVYIITQQICEEKRLFVLKKFLIIDGSSMLSTAYYGTLPKSIQFAKSLEEKEAHYSEILHTSDGRYTNAMLTMLRSLFRLLNEVRPDYFAVAFDMSRNTFRRTELGATFYKANRTAVASPLKQQFIQMEDFLRKIGVPVLCGEHYEADDYVASVVSRFSDVSDLQFIIHTKDHDFMQLVSDNVVLWRPMVAKRVQELLSSGVIDGSAVVLNDIVVYDSALVKYETGVYPSQIVDLLAITGDAGDGIPGCKGVSSAAAPLLCYSGSLQGLYDTLDSLQNKSEEKVLLDVWKSQYGVTRNPMNALRKYREDVMLSQKLAQMKRDIDEIPKDLVCYDLHLDVPMLWSLLQSYEMKSLMTYISTILREMGLL